MSQVVVQLVATRAQRRAFVEFPWDLYRDDPCWVPPLRGNLKELLGYKHHPLAENVEIQTFLAYRDGRVVGRVAAIVNKLYIQRYDERRGFIGYFESIDDQQVANALLQTALDWFRQRDIHSLRGPTNPTMNYECGMLIEGFDTPPTFMMTYNPPYYDRLWKEFGFKKAVDLLAYVGQREQLPEIERRLGPIAAQAADRSGATIKYLDRSRFLQDVELFLDMYNQAMSTTWSFVPIPKNEMRHMANSLKHLLIPELAVLAEAEGRCVGAILGLPDYNPRIKQIDGRLFPFGFIRLLWNKGQMKRMRVLSINVVPEFQRWGVGLLLMQALVPKAMSMGIETAEFSWILEDNDLACMGLEKGGATIEKRFRMYDWDPPPSG